MTPEVQFEKLHAQAKLPFRATQDSSGYDVCSDIDVTLEPGVVVKVTTGLIFSYITVGYDVQIRARSSFAAKGIILPNSPGLIDNMYRDELCILLLNCSNQKFHIKAGERIAQLTVHPIQTVRFVDVTGGDYKIAPQSNTKRSGGFGSTNT